MIRSLLPLVMLLWAVAQPAGAQVEGYVLRAEDVACLREHAAAYRALPGDPLFVAIADCPDIPANPLLGTLTNEGPDVQLSDDVAYDNFVYLTRAQLDCLLSAEAPPGAALYAFTPQRCALEPRD